MPVYDCPHHTLSGIDAHMRANYTYHGVLGYGSFGLVLRVEHKSAGPKALKIVVNKPENAIPLQMEVRALMAISSAPEPQDHLATMFEFMKVV